MSEETMNASTQEIFHTAVTSAGVELERGRRVSWLTNRGHVASSLDGLVPLTVLDALDAMHTQLGGDRHSLETKRSGRDPIPDFFFRERGWIVELDEEQHFTTDRLLTFDLYPDEVDVAYDVAAYRGIARR